VVAGRAACTVDYRQNIAAVLADNRMEERSLQEADRVGVADSLVHNNPQEEYTAEVAAVATRY
jgi:hypothetical protein